MGEMVEGSADVCVVVVGVWEAPTLLDPDLG
jgi:hypothetical protein